MNSMIANCMIELQLKQYCMLIKEEFIVTINPIKN